MISERSPGAAVLEFRLPAAAVLEADAQRTDKKEGNYNHDRSDEILAVELK
jgi:hypothetical protein